MNICCTFSPLQDFIAEISQEVVAELIYANLPSLPLTLMGTTEDGRTFGKLNVLTNPMAFEQLLEFLHTVPTLATDK